jgi:hypothetical protein
MSTSARQLRSALGRTGLATIAALAAAWSVQAAPSRADVTPAPAWTLLGSTQPTNFASGSTYATGGDSYVITATNTGGAAASAPSSGGTAITITDTLPAGITPDATHATGVDNDGNTVKCTSSGSTVTCVDKEDVSPLLSDQQVQITVPVDVSSGAVTNSSNQASVSGGGGPAQSTSVTTTISGSGAAFGIVGAGTPQDVFTAHSLNADGTVDTQAGSTPNQVLTTLAFNSIQASNGNVVPAGDLRDTTLALPPGLVGNPMAVPTCSQAAMDTPADGSDGSCPTDTQVGIADVEVVGPTGPEFVEAPIYNLAAPAGMPAEFAFSVLTSVIHIDFSLQPDSASVGGYTLEATISGTNAGAPVLSATILVWGNPASGTHDDARFEPGASGAGPGTNPIDPSSSQPIASTLTPASLLSNPTSCGTTDPTSISVDDWQDPTSELPDSFASPDVTGCVAEAFTPSVAAQPTSAVASSPAGLNVDINVPQNSSPTAIPESNLKDVTVTLPAGVAVSPSGANGLQACSEAQIGLGTNSAPACPAASALGTVEIDTPLLAVPLEGAVYLAQQTANPFGSLLAIYVTASADGVQLKLAGRVNADPSTGQLTTTFDNNPQLPFSELKLDFFGGPNAPLSMPSACGTYTTTTALSSWSDPTALALGSSSFTINSGCMSGFAPTFTAGTTGAKAGSFSPFVLSFSRADTDQYLSGLQVKLPEGMLARITGVKECTAAELASISSQPGTGVAQEANPSCPSGSRVGSASVAAGPGTDPYHLTGQVYLTGPYNGGSFGLAVVVPAVAGPLDLGTVVVRQALDINPRTARVTVTSDPFPTMLDGIPLQLRDVSVDLNRHHFTVDPTSCGSMAVTGTLASSAGSKEAVRSAFHVSDCGALRFSPTLSMALTGRHQTSVGTHPTLTADLTQPAGQANVRSEKVTLPLSLALDPNNSEHVCSVQDAAKVACPKRTLVGKALALTRILPTPLKGNVYLVQGERKDKQGQILRTLPKLLIPLRGDHVAINLVAQTSVDSTEHLVTTFPAVPDAAIRSFKLTITGGQRGILVVTGSKSLCAGPQVGDVVAIGHNGKQRSDAVAMSTSACAAHPKKG